MTGPAEQMRVADESGHPASAIEWWFVQGRFCSSRGERSRFMAALLTHYGRSAADPPAFTLLTSVLDPGAARHRCASRINRAACDLVSKAAPHLKKANLDPALLDAHAREAAEYGPPRPIVLSETTARLCSAPFTAEWDDFTLTASDNKALLLRFNDPAGDREYRFRLTPCIERVHMRDVRAWAEGGMDYVTYPALRLEGTAGAEPVEGEAWMDHQWGDHSWFLSAGRGVRALGWDWLAASLDDGSRVMVILHHDARRRVFLSRHAVLMRRGQPHRIVHSVEAEPLATWRSLETGAAYPVEWRFRIPDFDAELRFTPHTREQEIPVFGPLRAIWEGTGTVEGLVEGGRAAGEARLELNGYAYQFGLDARWRAAGVRMDRHLAAFLPKRMNERKLRRYVGPPLWKHEPGAYTKVLTEPMWDLIERGGKRWRPVLGVLLLETLGVAARPWEPLVAVVAELPHTGALIIDDIQDQSPLRRGRKSIHLRYGVDVAINAANTSYFLPYLVLRDQPDLTEAQRLHLYRILSEQSVRSHLGQGTDIFWSRELTPGRIRRWMSDSMAPKILQAYAYKTAALVEGVALAACVVAGAGEEVSAACASFARKLGVAFQIVDDVQGFKSPGSLRKRAGEDLSQGKMTYVIFRALERLPAPERRRLGGILSRGGGGGVPEGIALVKASGALELCAKEACDLFEDGYRELAAVTVPTESRTLLRIFCSKLIRVP